MANSENTPEFMAETAGDDFAVRAVLYGEKLLGDAFLNIQADSFEEKHLLERIIKRAPAVPTNLPSPWFVTCFSKEKDDLSQWRAYSGGENGYAIAFLAQGFFGRRSVVVRVNYDQEQQRQVAAKVANATLAFFKEGLHARPTGEVNTAAIDAWATEFLNAWQEVVGKLAPMVKHPAFASEREYRIVHELRADEFPKLRFRQKQTLMSRHLPLVFPPLEGVTESKMLPIAEVMVGPSRHKEISAVSVRAALLQKGYTWVPVTISEIPFQST
jgi:hypothetical protein